MSKQKGKVSTFATCSLLLPIMLIIMLYYYSFTTKTDEKNERDGKLVAVATYEQVPFAYINFVL